MPSALASSTRRSPRHARRRAARRLPDHDFSLPPPGVRILGAEAGQGGRAHFLHSQKSACKSLIKRDKILAPYLANVRVEGSNPFSRSKISEQYQGASPAGPAPFAFPRTARKSPIQLSQRLRVVEFQHKSSTTRLALRIMTGCGGFEYHAQIALCTEYGDHG